MSAAALKPKPPPNPLIPEKYIDVPSQRLYYLSLGLLCQAIKTLDFIVSFAYGGDHMATCRKWLLVDFLYVVVLAQLRIPRLQYKTPSVILQIALLWLVDGLLFGGISINLPVFWGTGLTLSAGLPGFGIRDIISPLTFGLVSSTGSGDGHLLGQHTVRMSPISTAHLNPQNQNYCLSPTVGFVLVPIVLNNTQLAGLRYSVSPLGAQGKLEVHDVTAKELKVMEQAYRDRMKLQAQPAARNTEEYDEYDYDDDDDEEGGGGGGGTRDAHANLGRTQSLAHLMLTKPGIVRLERASDATGATARLVMSDTVVVPCPTVSFAPDEGAALEPVRCAHGRTDPQLKIKVSGVPPLSLRWMRTINGQREQFVVEGIEGEQQQQLDGNAKAGSGKEGTGAVVETRDDGLPGRPRVPSSQTVTIPLSIALEEPGTYLYALEEITDGVGNTLRVGIDASATASPSTDNGNGSGSGGSSFFSSSSSASSSNYKTLEDLTKTATTRSFVVLQKPAVSFGFCSLDTPASLLIGKSTNLMLRASNVDAFDAPLEVEVAYEPSTNASDSPETSSSKKGSSSGKGASKSRIIKLTAQDTRYEVPVAQPGDYRIMGVKGKYCTGTVLAPDACRVVEKPRPRAEVDWKRIHECSGDTGVSASLVLHGTPPFQVYYRMQHKPSATQHGGGDTRELSKTFTSARGELVLQPPRSGKYTFTIFAVSDANYKKVEIKNSSIDQEIHPLAAAEFTGGSGDSSGSGGRGAGKKIMRSMCTGDSVEVGVALSGTAPWTVGLQIIGPNHAEVMQIQGIEDARTTLQVPIPKELRTNSGAFEIDLVSVEDQSKCKQPVSVPGIQVKVKRTVPTAQFYGRPEERHVTVTENDKASLPLRLTGDKPWHVTYRNQRTGATRTAAFHDQNANIQVADRGTYEIMSVKDSHCPGKVVTEASTFGVDWVPRPFVKLSSSVDAVYDSYKSLYTLKPICEGVNDHVDLDLTGRPPFQIMYNIGQDSDNGGTKIVSQPTFNSIQPRTRFQLQTTTPGRMYYEVKQVGDAAYPLSKTRETVIPLSERLLFQQQVFVRPSARFRNRNRLTYCLHDPLVVTPDTAGFSDGLITLEGTPPFIVDVSIKNIGASVTEIRTLHIPSNTWKVDIPSYSFSSIGPHLLSIEKVVDSSSCEQAALDPLYRSIWLDVAETAAIIPFERREDICVGDVTQFQLEGIPPWTIGYKVNGRSHTQEAKTSPFSIQQQYPGTFVVSSIAHQQKMCKAAVTDLKFNIHALPSAKVGHGERIFQDIHEGDQAEIVFTLIGEPPFTFTYQRSELSTKKGVLGKVLETHTVSRVQTHEYSIFSALEGTWTVTSISDKYCRYPPAQPDPLAVEKHK